MNGLNPKWDLRFLEMARLVSSWSKDPSTQCGAVIVRPDKTVATLGYNGFPKGCDDDPAIYADREVKYSRVLHAEVNAVLSARERLDGYTLYTWPGGAAPTCDRCATVVIQAGIARVVHIKETSSAFSTRWLAACQSSLQMYSEAGVTIDTYEMGDLNVGI